VGQCLYIFQKETTHRGVLSSQLWLQGCTLTLEEEVIAPDVNSMERHFQKLKQVHHIDITYLECV
jgi:hypothetical protein